MKFYNPLDQPFTFLFLDAYNEKITLNQNTLQERMQHFKEVSQTDLVQTFPLTAVWTSRYTSVIICACYVISFKTFWFGVHQCKISWKLHPSGKAQYLKHWLTVTSAKHQKNLQPAKQGLISLIPEAAVHINFAVNLARFFRTLILY